jgi:unconventional prefoldin RPB5 interactor 1
MEIYSVVKKIYLHYQQFDTLVSENNAILQKKEQEAAEKRLAEIETAKQEAIKKEQARKAEEDRIAEIKRKEEEARKAEELAKASDKVKYAELIEQIEAIKFPDMRSGQYRKKVVLIREKIEEIYSL